MSSPNHSDHESTKTSRSDRSSEFNFPNSSRVYAANEKLRVPMREIRLNQTRRLDGSLRRRHRVRPSGSFSGPRIFFADRKIEPDGRLKITAAHQPTNSKQHNATMPHLQLTIDIGTRDPQPIEDALFELGAVSVTLLDAADDPVLEPAPGQTPLWPTVVVRALFDSDTDPKGLTAAIADACGPGLQGAVHGVRPKFK